MPVLGNAAISNAVDVGRNEIDDLALDIHPFEVPVKCLRDLCYQSQVVVGTRGHFNSTYRMSLKGQKQTSRQVGLMSALPPKADIDGRRLDVRFVPLAEVRPSRSEPRRVERVGDTIDDAHSRGAIHQKERIAVRRRSHDEFGADIAGGARPVVDDE
jgi:hypothetical protein